MQARPSTASKKAANITITSFAGIKPRKVIFVENERRTTRHKSGSKFSQARGQVLGYMLAARRRQRRRSQEMYAMDNVGRLSQFYILRQTKTTLAPFPETARRTISRRMRRRFIVCWCGWRDRSERGREAHVHISTSRRVLGYMLIGDCPAGYPENVLAGTS